MNKSACTRIVFCLSLLVLSSPLAGQAEEQNSTKDTLSQAPATANPSQGAPASNKNTNKPFSPGRLPLYLVGIATGACVGMPISLVRRTVWEEKQGIQGLCGDSKNKVAIVSAGAFWLPFSVFLGAAEAPVMGPVNSLRNYDKPFSKEQFSLGALGDGGSRDPG